MKNQASLNLKVVDNPISNKANTGCISIRATTNGLVVVDDSGVIETVGQKYTINNVSADNDGKFTISAGDIGAAENTHTHFYSDIVDGPVASSGIVLGIIKAYNSETKTATVQEANVDWTENESGTLHENVIVP